MLPECQLTEIHAERLRKRIPWPLVVTAARRIADVELPVMLDPGRGDTLLAALRMSRLKSRERSRGGPSWRCVATLYAAAERALGFDPDATDRWLTRRFGAGAMGLEMDQLRSAIALLRSEHTTHTTHTTHSRAPGAIFEC